MFILMLYTSSFIFQPKSLTVLTFQTQEQCEQVLNEAKKEWVTINSDSKCVDVVLLAEIRKKEAELSKLRSK